MSTTPHRVIAGLTGGILAPLMAVSPCAASGIGPPAPPWGPPVTAPVLVRSFAPPAAPWLPGHRGIDLRVGVGTRVLAPAPGVVSFVGSVAGRGVLTIDHGGLRTSYEPIDASVVPGEQVASGSPIGTVASGSGHCGSGACLHLGLRRGIDYLDPMLVLAPATSRLLPW